MKSSVRKNREQQGYVLLLLLLFVALLSFGFLAAIENFEFDLRRDQELELIHRGVQYSRAVRKYVKQFGRYPTSIEALENSNNIRFLRKRYKDPITKKDFKLLYYADVETLSHSSLLTSPSSVLTNTATATTTLIKTPSPATAASVAATDSQEVSPDPDGAIPAEGRVAPESADQNQGDETAQDGGGRAIVGVTSFSARETIRVFNKKDHYNQWQFVYDPGADYGLIIAPNQTKAAGMLQPLQNNQRLTSNSSLQGADH